MANTQKLCDLLTAKVACDVALGKLYLLKNNYIGDRVYNRIFKAIDALEVSIENLDFKIQREKTEMWQDLKREFELKEENRKNQIKITKKD